MKILGHFSATINTVTAARAGAHFRDRRRPKYLLSGLARCGLCGSGYVMISATALGCAANRNKGTCVNRHNIRRSVLEQQVLAGLRHHLMTPDLFAQFCVSFTDEVNRLRTQAGAAIVNAEAEIRRIDRDLDMLVNLILRGGAADRINARMVTMEARKKALERALATAEEPPPLLHPNMALHYREQLDELYQALREDCEAKRLEAAEIIRSLVQEIVMTPERSN